MPKGVYTKTELHKRQISDSLRGRRVSPNTEFKKGEYQGFGFQKGKVGYWKGKKRPPFSNVWKERMSKVKTGTRNAAWKDGVTKKPDYWATMKHRRRTRKLGNGGTHTLGEWNKLKKQYAFTCPSCLKQEPEVRLTQDHIVPISLGGSDDIQNIQPLCKRCNCKKNTKIIKYNIWQKANTLETKK